MNKVEVLLYLALLSAVAACERAETLENVYPDYQAVISAGAIERGWIPSFLPATAKEIREKHNLDTNEVWLRFSAESRETGFVEKTCKAVRVENIGLPREAGGDWWPSALSEKSREAAEVDEFVYYRCRDGALVARRPNEKEVYYWRLGE